MLTSSQGISKRPRSYTTKNKRPTKKMKGFPRVVSQQLAYRKIRPEYKCTDESQIGVSVTSTPTITSLTTNMAHSTGTLNAYIGGNVDPQSIQLRWHLVACQDSLLSPITSDSSNNVRISLIQWLADSTPVPGDIFQALTPQNTISAWSVNNLDKMNVLYDQVFPTYLTCFRTGISSNLASGNAYSERVYVKGRKIAPLRFNNAGSATEFGDIYMIVSSDSTTTPHPTISWYSRLTYTD